MSSRNEQLYYELDALCALAARVLNEHTNEDGACRACGQAFPCARACLAEHNLDVRDEPSQAVEASGTRGPAAISPTVS